MEQVARPRLGVRGVFFLNGLTLSTYIVRIPSLKLDHHLDDGRLGVIGLLFGLAALAAMQGVGPLVARVGSRPVLQASLVVMPLLLAVVAMTHGFWPLAVALMTLAAVHGTTDAAMNAHAVAVERLEGRPVLSSCHAAWSISAVTASLAGALFVHWHVSLAAHLYGAAAVCLVGGVLVGPLLLPAEADRHPGARASRASAGWRTGWTRAVVLLGLTGTVLMVCEAAALGWGSVFLHDARHASLALAATAVTAYTGGQTVGRTFGDRLTSWYGAAALFRTGGLVAVAGLLLAVLTPVPGLAVAGFAVMGVGGSVLLPLTFSAVGHAGGSGPGAATFVSRFTTFTYAGILLGPAVIGLVAQGVGLTWTLAALVPMLAVVAVRSPMSRPSVISENATTESSAPNEIPVSVEVR